MAKVTIEDISRQTGLSRGTVSRALNNRPDISAQTKQRVLEACQKLNYVPSYAARSLATGRNYAAAVVVGDLDSSFASGLLRGVIQRADRDRYAVQVIELAPDDPGADERLRRLAAERIDGVFLAIPVERSSIEHVRESLGDRRIVSCWPIRGVSCDTFALDHAEAGRMALRYLLSAGLRNVRYLFREDSAAGAARREGFREACSASGVDAAAALLRVDPQATVAGFASRLASAEAIIADDAALAIEAMLTVSAAGRAPGRDVAVVSLEEDRVATRVRPALSTIAANAQELGRRAMESLLQRVGGEREDAPQAVLVAPTLHRRETTPPSTLPEPAA